MILCKPHSRSLDQDKDSDVVHQAGIPRGIITISGVYLRLSLV